MKFRKQIVIFMVIFVFSMILLLLAKAYQLEKYNNAVAYTDGKLISQIERGNSRRPYVEATYEYSVAEEKYTMTTVEGQKILGVVMKVPSTKVIAYKISNPSSIAKLNEGESLKDERNRSVMWAAATALIGFVVIYIFIRLTRSKSSA